MSLFLGCISKTMKLFSGFPIFPNRCVGQLYCELIRTVEFQTPEISLSSMCWLALGKCVGYAAHGGGVPAIQKNCLGRLGDLGSVYPWHSIDMTLDRDRNATSRSPFLACRQCHRKEKAPLSPLRSISPLILHQLGPNQLLWKKRTGRYPEVATDVFGECNPEFPISLGDWMGATIYEGT